MRKVSDLKPGDTIRQGGVVFTVKSVHNGEDGNTTLVFEDMPATDENAAAFRELQEATRGTGMFVPVKLGANSWKNSESAKFVQMVGEKYFVETLSEELRSMCKGEMLAMEGRPWMKEAVAWGARLQPEMTIGGIYLHQAFTTTFVHFGRKAAAEAFIGWASENIDHWGDDPVALIDTNDPEVCERWKHHIRPLQNYRDSILHGMIQEKYGGYIGHPHCDVFLPSEVELKASQEGKAWWLRTPNEMQSVSVVICVECGSVTDVYASKKGVVDISIIDSDTDDADREAEIEAAVSDLRKQIEAGEMFQVY